MSDKEKEIPQAGRGLGSESRVVDTSTSTPSDSGGANLQTYTQDSEMDVDSQTTNITESTSIENLLSQVEQEACMGSGSTTNPSIASLEKPDNREAKSAAADSGSGSTTNLEVTKTASKLNRLHLNKPRLSGAQRRKMRIAEAIAKGEPILPRKPRKGGMAKETGSQPSLTPKTPNPKRPRSVETSPIEAKAFTPLKRAKHTEVKPQSKPLTTYEGVEGASFSDAVKQLKMAVVPERYPEEKISEEKMKLLTSSLTKEIFKSSSDGAPRFTNFYNEKGVLHITCADQSSRLWLVDRLSGPLKNCVGIPLKVGLSKDILKTTKMIVYVPDELYNSLGIDQPKSVIPLLATQNPGLSVEDIRVLHSQKDSKGTTLVVLVGEENLRSLREMGFKAHLGLSQLTFKVQGGRVDTQPSCAAATSSKPAAQ